MTDSSVAMERALLGALFMDRDAIASVVDRLTPDAFAVSDHAEIYAAMMRCWEKRTPPDIITVFDELTNAGHDWDILPSDMLEMMGETVMGGYGVHAPFYAERVIQYARRRAMAEAGAKIVQLSADSGETDTDLLLHEAMSGLDRFGAVEEKRGPRTYEELVPEFQDRAMRTRSGEIINTRTPTGYRDVDRMLSGGFLNGDLVILAARPGMGKTSLALNIAHNVARAGRHVMVFSAEMSAESLLRRAVTDLSGLDSHVVFGETFNDQQFDAFLHATERLALLPVSIDDTSGISTAQMLVRIQAAQRRHDIGLVVFDYISLAGDVVTGEGEHRRITEIVRKLKHIARVCNVPVLALAQLNRNVERQENKRPALSDLRESGSIEEEADKVLFQYRNAYYVAMGRGTPDLGRENICEVIVAKHRNGSVGTVDLYFKPETMTFHTVARSEAGG
jgi:replicative DNA helicase